MAFVAIGLAPRLAGAAEAVPEPFRLHSDPVQTYLDSGLAGHRLPYFEAPFAYPPVIGYLSGALSLLAADVVGFTAGWGLLLCALAGAAGYALSREAGPSRALRYWALSPQLLLFGSLNFDVLPAACVVGAAILERRRRHHASMGLLALGAAAKFFPAAAAPLVPLRLLRAGALSRAVLVASAFALILGAFYVPSLLAQRSSAPFVATYAVGVRPNFDSPWGLLHAVLLGLGVGEAQLIVLVVTAAGFALTYLLGVLRRALDAADAVVPLALATLTLLLWSRLYSPQYTLWALPFFVLLPLPGRTFALLTAGDLLVFASIYPLTLTPPGRLPLFELVVMTLATGIVLRHLGLALAWRDTAREIDGRPGSPR